MGDVVLSTPVVEALRLRWPDAYIAVMARPYTRDIWLENPYIDQILTDDPNGENRGVSGFMRQIARLRAHRFDTALMLLPTPRMAWMLFLSGIPRRIGVGTKIYQFLTMTRSVSRNRYVPLRHEADYCLDLVRRIGAPADRWRATIALTEEERRQASERLAAAGAVRRPWIGVHPGNGHSAPNWPPERYGELVRHLQRRFDATVVVTGQEEEAELIRRMNMETENRSISFAGRLSLRQLIGVIGEMDVFFSSSTGPMHIAAALRIPTVSLFCPLPVRSPQRWGPLSDRSITITPPDGPCATCERGPLCGLEEVGVDTVLAAVERQLFPS
ncbi:MAG: glycosyltransferase family 9 protein [candidate division Zixibacteria bacterium]|nr:glycosyltransferase family 9 protein [candidate division Zixibacteria bacterium]